MEVPGQAGSSARDCCCSVASSSLVYPAEEAAADSVVVADLVEAAEQSVQSMEDSWVYRSDSRPAFPADWVLLHRSAASTCSCQSLSG